MKTIIIQLLLCVSLLVTAQANSKHCNEPITSKARDKVALSYLKKAPDTVQVYVKGLICESCCIGVRKKVQRLKFVDTKKPKKGIILNVRSQLVSISLKKGKVIDKKALVKAVKGAGYEAVTLYTLDKGKRLRAESLAPKPVVQKN